MSLITAPNPFTAEQYREAFTRAQAIDYPTVDALEARTGYALDRARLDHAAAVLCCPIKAKPPHWQHGRVLYALLRRELETIVGAVRVLDIGTSKGFSALCLRWALLDADRQGVVHSVDVMPPGARLRRNTPVELDGLKTLAEILAPWPEARDIVCVESTGIDWLARHPNRVQVAFVDGKHTTEVVHTEGMLLAGRQETGDLVVFDDCQMPAVRAAVRRLDQWYALELLEAPPRVYGIARRR